MESRLLKPAALSAVAVLASACAPGKIGAGCRPTDTSKDSPRAASSPDHTDWTAEDEPNAVDKGTDHEARGAGAGPERPWAHNTGPRDPGALVPTASLTITTSGATYENIDVTGRIKIDADNVTIRNFRVSGASHYSIQFVDGHTGNVIEDGEITGATGTSACIVGQGWTGRRLHIHDCPADGVKVQAVRVAPPSGPTLLEYSFIEKLGVPGGGHVDGVQTRGARNATFRYNNIYMPYPGSPGDPNSDYKSNSTFIVQLDVSNYLIEHNWLTGGNYTIYCQDTGHDGIRVRNNLFGRDYKYGIVSGTCAEWSGNTWEDTGDPI